MRVLSSESTNHELATKMKRSGPLSTLPDRSELAAESSSVAKCLVHVVDHELEGLTLDVCDSLKVAGCPLATHVSEQHKFEQFLTELSATFVKVQPSEVDANISSALQRIVEFLGIDRSGFGELTPDGCRILQSYELPGIPPSPRVILEQTFPSFAKLLVKGDAFRMPEDLPPEAEAEREYSNEVGLKSNLTIPLKSMGTVVGGIGFAMFRYHRHWSDELVQRLSLIGEIFTNAIERKRADAELRAKETSLHRAHDDLRQLAAKLLNAQEEERRRIAREMHDDWTQRLAILGIDVAKIVNQPDTSENVRKPLRAMQDELIRLSEDVHALSRRVTIQLHGSLVAVVVVFRLLRRLLRKPGCIPTDGDLEHEACGGRSSRPTGSTHPGRCGCSSCSYGSLPPAELLVLPRCCPTEPRHTTGKSTTRGHTLPSVWTSDSHQHAPRTLHPASLNAILASPPQDRMPLRRVFPSEHAASWHLGTH